MKPNELRIGNIITSESWRGYRRVSGIERIDNDVFEVKVSGFVHRHEKGTWFELAPIPLTEELLLKCGFIKSEDDIFHLQWSNGFSKPKTIGIELEGGESFASFHIGEGVDMMLIDVHHLHQLQNLYFALTGEELEINL